jgi:hypothetical protein
MAEFPAPNEGIVLTHFIVSGDVERSRRFYTDVLGGESILEGEPSGWWEVGGARWRCGLHRRRKSRP